MAYTNSPLVSYTRLSPNHSGQRTHSIDRITPHCVVGQCSVETLGNIFAPVSRQASCQYGIGSDGRIGMYVEEKNRSWCSSSNANDQRAVTIEAASDLNHPYAMFDKVYQALIELCADICKRNGKKKLLWLATKEKALAYMPAEDEMVLTAHRWFAAKACPGDWLYSREADLASKVNAILGAEEKKPEPAPAPEPDKKEETALRLYRVQVGAYRVYENAINMKKKLEADKYQTLLVKVGDIYKVQTGAFSIKTNAENLAKELKAKGYDVFIADSQATAAAAQKKEESIEKTIWDFFIGKGLNSYAVAGIMGNLKSESNLDPQNLQNAFESRLSMSDAEYTTRTDNGSYLNFVYDSAGYGLSQWTFWSRKKALLEYARSSGKSIGNLGMQLDFMWNEMQGYTVLMKTLKSAVSVRQASNSMLTVYLRPADQGTAVQNRRTGFGEEFYKKYAA